jgi:hypothetical protein
MKLRNILHSDQNSTIKKDDSNNEEGVVVSGHCATVRTSWEIRLLITKDTLAPSSLSLSSRISALFMDLYRQS